MIERTKEGIEQFQKEMEKIKRSLDAKQAGSNERERLLSDLHARAIIRHDALTNLKHARTELHAAETQYANANEDYQRIIYNLLTLKAEKVEL